MPTNDTKSPLWTLRRGERVGRRTMPGMEIDPAVAAPEATLDLGRRQNHAPIADEGADILARAKAALAGSQGLEDDVIAGLNRDQGWEDQARATERSRFGPMDYLKEFGRGAAEATPRALQMGAIPFSMLPTPVQPLAAGYLTLSSAADLPGAISEFDPEHPYAGAARLGLDTLGAAPGVRTLAKMAGAARGTKAAAPVLDRFMPNTSPAAGSAVDDAAAALPFEGSVDRWMPNSSPAAGSAVDEGAAAITDGGDDVAQLLDRYMPNRSSAAAEAERFTPAEIEDLVATSKTALGAKPAVARAGDQIDWLNTDVAPFPRSKSTLRPDESILGLARELDPRIKALKDFPKPSGSGETAKALRQRAKIAATYRGAVEGMK